MIRGIDTDQIQEVILADSEIIIIGIPKENSNHNCEYMGCVKGKHVIFRAVTAYPRSQGISFISVETSTQK